MTAARVTNTAEDGLPLPQRYWAIFTLVIGMVVSVLDTAIVNIALPTIAKDLDTGAAQSIWIINAYQLAVVISLLPLASLGDIFGPPNLYNRLRSVHVRGARQRSFELAGDAGIGPRTAGPWCRRHDERQHGAGAVHLPAAAVGTGHCDDRGGGFGFVRRGAERCVSDTCGGVMALALRDQRADRPRHLPAVAAVLAPQPAVGAPLRHGECGVERAFLCSPDRRNQRHRSRSGGQVRRDRTDRRGHHRHHSRTPTSFTEPATSTSRSVQAPAVCAVGYRFRLHLCGARDHLRHTPLLFPRCARALTGRHRIADDAMASHGYDHRTDRRQAR